MSAAAALFVSTALEVWRTAQPERVARDFQVNDTVYRRLDPEYYAWLRSRMHLAKMSAEAGQLEASEFETLRSRFNQIQEWALEHFGRAALEEALHTLDARQYSAPRAETERPGRRVVSAGVPPTESHALIAGIREQALSLGWSEAQLSAVPPEARHGELVAGSGLVCYLRAGDQIGAVTGEAIEIILANGVRQNFYNPDVEQPWSKRVAR
jgi:hypothetical protein